MLIARPHRFQTPVWDGLQEQEVICSATRSWFIHVFKTFHFQRVFLYQHISENRWVSVCEFGGVVESTVAYPKSCIMVLYLEWWNIRICKLKILYYNLVTLILIILP
ncbi:hypothetical protein Ddye_013818 [Dipteronia dyeriana]|uniref:Uncharacterized protein n=1 Tax=Dipteronia dyeriana TaxID=168575 RepID=A0AAD9X736_9ROSI|nr:hypothetical protein Ddye_013818 [Dipteronia dyeriana]